MKKNLFSSALIAIAVVLLAGCTSNDPEKLAVGTWTAVSYVASDADEIIKIDENFETQTMSYYVGGTLAESDPFPYQSTLTLDEQGNIKVITTSNGEVTESETGTYKIEKKRKELLFVYTDGDGDSMQGQITTLTNSALVLETTQEIEIPDSEGKMNIKIVLTYKR